MGFPRLSPKSKGLQNKNSHFHTAATLRVLVRLTSFLEADARCRGVNQPWSLALTLAPGEETKEKSIGQTEYNRDVQTYVQYIHLKP